MIKSSISSPVPKQELDDFGRFTARMQSFHTFDIHVAILISNAPKTSIESAGGLSYKKKHAQISRCWKTS